MVVSRRSSARREQVRGRGAPKAVDGLRVIADERDARVVAAQPMQHVELQEVDVLKLVDENVVVRAAELFTQGLVLRDDAPEEQEVVEVEESERALPRRRRR